MAFHLIPADDNLHHALHITEELARKLIDDPNVPYDAHHAANTAARLTTAADPDRRRPITIEFSNGWEPVPLTAVAADTADLHQVLVDVDQHHLDEDLADLIDTTPANRAQLRRDLAGLRQLLEIDHGPDFDAIAKILDPEPLHDAVQQLIDGNAPSGRQWTRIIRLDQAAEATWQRATKRITTATQPDPITRDILYRQPRPVDPALRNASADVPAADGLRRRE